MFKVTGLFIELFSEHRRSNATSFPGTGEDFETESGVWQRSPAQVAAGRTAGLDITAYPNPPTAQDSWQARRIGSHPSPAQVAAAHTSGGSGSFERGSAT